jgi:hypothetical protein
MTSIYVRMVILSYSAPISLGALNGTQTEGQSAAGSTRNLSRVLTTTSSLRQTPCRATECCHHRGNVAADKNIRVDTPLSELSFRQSTFQHRVPETNVQWEKPQPRLISETIPRRWMCKVCTTMANQYSYRAAAWRSGVPIPAGAKKKVKNNSEAYPFSCPTDVGKSISEGKVTEA